MNGVYSTLSGRVYSLSEFNPEESKLFTELSKKFAKGADWNDFENYWIAALSALYDERGISRRQSRESALYQIAQDMWNRLAIQQGHVEPPDYRDELAELIGREYGTRRAFCRKTGMSEQMVSHALAHRKHIHIHRLVRALDKIGYRLSITPAPTRRKTRPRKNGRSRTRRVRVT